MAPPPHEAALGQYVLRKRGERGRDTKSRDPRRLPGCGGEQEALLFVKKCLTENKAPVARSRGRLPRLGHRAMRKGGPRPEPKEARTEHRALEKQPPARP